jgi:anti-sigma factor RsiW
MKCDKAGRLISDGLDGVLEGARKARLEAHLAGCASCRARREGLLRLQEAARASAPAAPDSERLARSLARLKAGIRGEAAAAPRLHPSRAVLYWLPAGAAAALLVAATGLYFFLRPAPAVDFVPYAYSDAGAGLAVTLAEDENLAQAFDSAIRTELAENGGRYVAAVESKTVDTGLFLDSLTDEEVLILEAVIGAGEAL